MSFFDAVYTWPFPICRIIFVSNVTFFWTQHFIYNVGALVLSPMVRRHAVWPLSATGGSWINVSGVDVSSVSVPTNLNLWKSLYFVIMKEDIWCFNFTWLELIIVSSFKYMFSCTGGNVRFVMTIPVVLWFTDNTTDVVFLSFSCSTPVMSRSPFLVRVMDMIIRIIQTRGTGC